MIPARYIIWCVVTILAAAAGAYGVSLWVVREATSEGGADLSFHDWLHSNLQITPEQERRLHPHERDFQRQLGEQQARIRATGQTLAQAIRNHDADSQEVARAQEQLLQAQGELQRITLEHFFAMKEHLNPEQGELLLQWTHDSIIHGHHD